MKQLDKDLSKVFFNSVEEMNECYGTNAEFLTSGGELSKEIEYTTDDDNVLVLYQGKSRITLTYRQIVDVKEFMDAYIDTIDYATMKRINDEK